MLRRQDEVTSRERDACAACGATSLSEALALPGFPLTGIYVSGKEVDLPTFDQSLMHCSTCGHAQLLRSIDPRYLYETTYSHRTTPSPMACRGNDFFAAFVDLITQGRKFRCIVEVGCNDLYLLEKFRGRADVRVGVDPIWKGRIPDGDDSIHVIGSYIEDVDWDRTLPEAPDLVLSVHTLEHVEEPAAALEELVARSTPDAIFVVEVPGFDSMLTATRFDQVFHQHLNYFSLASFEAMLRRLGCESIAHTFNFDYWNGTMLVAFRKAPSMSLQRFEAPGRDRIAGSFALFQQQMNSLLDMITWLRGRGAPVIGYGAAQMVPTLAYHLGSNLAGIESILDDDPGKDGLAYPGLGVTIKSARGLRSLGESAVLITAVDSRRPITGRLIELDARYILSPFTLI